MDNLRLKTDILRYRDGHYNFLLSKIFKIFNYFCTVVLYFEYFRIVVLYFEYFCTVVLYFEHFRSHFCEFKFYIYFRIWFAKFLWTRKYRIFYGLNMNMKKIRFVFCETRKSGNKILLHCLITNKSGRADAVP